VTPVVEAAEEDVVLHYGHMFECDTILTDESTRFPLCCDDGKPWEENARWIACAAQGNKKSENVRQAEWLWSFLRSIRLAGFHLACPASFEQLLPAVDHGWLP
jgi:hypothetical protein